MSSNIKILPGDAVKHPRKMYQVVCYMRIDPAESEDNVPLTLADAYAEVEQLELMMPENKYIVELINDAE